MLFSGTSQKRKYLNSQIPVVDFYTIIADGERTKMNAQNQRNLKENLKKISEQSLSIIYSISDHTNETWKAAYKINNWAHDSLKYMNHDIIDYKSIANSDSWGEYAESRKQELN